MLSDQPAVDRELEQSCFDFVAYLARRHEVEPSVAKRELGRWLTRYERSEQDVAPRGRKPGPGIFARPVVSVSEPDEEDVNAA